MMKLIKSNERPAQYGLPEIHREWWDLGGGYEVFVILEEKNFRFSISHPLYKDITFQIAEYLGIETKGENNIVRHRKDDRELRLLSCIDGVVIDYRVPEKHKELLNKNEEIVNNYFISK